MSFTPTGPTQVRRVTAPEPPPAVVESRFVGRLEFQGWSFREGFRRDLGAEGPRDWVVQHLDANGLALTGNSETVYGTNFLDLKADGPTVVEVPPRVLGFFNDLWMRPIGDVGLAGPDHGQGGRYLLVPPGHDGELPEDTGEYVAVLRPRTYLVWFVLRAFMGPGGDAGPAKATLQQVRIYPWAQRQDPPAMRYLDASGKPYDTIHPIDGRYFAHLAAMVDYEPANAIAGAARHAGMPQPCSVQDGQRPGDPVGGPVHRVVGRDRAGVVAGVADGRCEL